MTIGQRIKKARLHRGLTQRELGILVGFSDSAADVRIAQYESSSRRPKSSVKKKLSEVLNVKLRYFYLSENLVTEDIILIMLELDEKLQIDLTPVYGKSRTRVNVHFDCEVIDDFLIEWMLQRQAFADNTITKQQYIDWVLTCFAMGGCQ